MTPGTVIKWHEGGTWSRRQVFGTVTRVTPKGTVYARADGQREGTDDYEFRRKTNDRYACEPATAHELAMIAWNRARPKTQHTRARYPLGAEDDAAPHGIVVLDNLPAVADTVRTAAAELLELAEWLDKMPVNRPGTGGTVTVAPSVET